MKTQISLIFTLILISSLNAQDKKSVIRQIADKNKSYKVYEISFLKHFKFQSGTDTTCDTIKYTVYQHASGPLAYHGSSSNSSKWQVRSAFDGRFLALLYNNKTYTVKDVFKKGQSAYMNTLHRDKQYRPMFRKAKDLAGHSMQKVDSTHVMLTARDSSQSPFMATDIKNLEQLTVNLKTGLIEKVEDWAWFDSGVQYRCYELLSIRALDKTFKDSIKVEAKKQIAAFRTYTSQDSLNEAYSKRFVLPEVGDTMPAFGARFYGSNDSISIHQGMDSIFVFDFFYTTCGPCMAAIPELRKIDSAYRSRGVVLMGIDPMPGDWQRLPKFMQLVNIPYPILQAPRTVSELFGVRAYPTLMVFQNGILRFIQVGYSDKLAEVLAKELDALLSR